MKHYGPVFFVSYRKLLIDNDFKFEINFLGADFRLVPIPLKPNEKYEWVNFVS